MFEAMVFGGLRRCEVLGLRLGDLDAAHRQIFIVEGKGGHQRQIPISRRWFSTVGDYLRIERPAEATTDRVFVVLKGQRRGRPLSFEGLNQVFVSARQHAGLRRITCHQLRHTCFTRLREAGMELEALQTMAGHRSIETTRLYVHLANGWIADEYDRACAVIDADMFVAAADGGRRMTALDAGVHVGYVAPGQLEFDWVTIAEDAPVLAATMLRYLDQLALSLRPASVKRAETMLRRFAGYLTNNHPEVESLIDVEASISKRSNAICQQGRARTVGHRCRR